jgi:uncharacterized protein YdhG (YjbR/CyaY superfamily)
MKQKEFKTTDEYISSFPEDIQAKLNLIRKTIHETAPDATEKIAYGMPTFYLNGNLVHFAAFKDHIGFFPAPSGINAFEDELKKYKTGKGTLQFSYNEEIPFDLIIKVTKFRMEENLNKSKNY